MAPRFTADGLRKLSRTRVDNFLSCPRCFYLDQRHGVGRPPGYTLSLNNAVDALLKAEFDGYRERGEPHPYMVQAGLDAVPARHELLNEWRHNFKGIIVQHQPTMFQLSGAIDDLWQDRKTGKYIVVDYKATARKEELSYENVTLGYRRQMEFYQWLLRGNGLDVDDTGYFVYCNGINSGNSFGINSGNSFGDSLRFRISVIPHKGSDAWVEPTLREIKEILESDALPAAAAECDHCKYVEKVNAAVSGLTQTGA